MEKLALLGIAGSLRRQSYAKALLRSLADALPPHLELRCHALDDVPLYNQDLDVEEALPAVLALRKAIAGADGLILASPEYNHGTSGVLKNALDWASRPNAAPPLRGKPVLIMSSSPGVTGGVRAQVQLVTTLLAAGARLVPGPQVAVGSAAEKIRDGELVDEATRTFMLGAVERLATEIGRLRTVA